MANIKVSEMTEATTFDEDDYTMIVQANQNKKITKTNMFDDINNNIGDLTQLETANKDNLVNSINNLCPTILYSDSEGSAINLTLTDSIENYDFYEIIFARDGYGYHSLKMPTDYLTNVSLITSFFAGNILRYYMANIDISGTTLTRNYAKSLNFTGQNAFNFGDETAFYIYKVIGYKVGKVEENEIQE